MEKTNKEKVQEIYPNATNTVKSPKGYQIIREAFENIQKERK